AYRHFKEQPESELAAEYQAFVEAESSWLEDFALFMAIKESHGGIPWDQWPEPLRLRQPDALQGFTRAHEDDLARHRFRQFLFFRQWRALKQYAAQKKVRIIGDIPIFVAYDSADVWSNP